MTRNEHLAVIFSGCSVLIAVASFGLSIWTHHQTQEFRKQHSQSRVVIQVGRDIHQPTVVFKKYDMSAKYGAIFREKYHVTINNIGFEPASITAMRVVGTAGLYGRKGTPKYGWYAGMNPRFESAAGSELHLPLQVKPEDPIGFQISVGIRIPRIAWNAVANKIHLGKKYDYYKIAQIFSQAGFLQFGQLEFRETDRARNFAITKYGVGKYYQRFIIYLTTGNGVQVCAKFSRNINYNVIQGQSSGLQMSSHKLNSFTSPTTSCS